MRQRVALSGRIIPFAEEVFDDEGEFIGWTMRPPYIRREYECDESNVASVLAAAQRFVGRLFKFVGPHELERPGIYRLEDATPVVDPRNGYTPLLVELVFLLTAVLDEGEGLHDVGISSGTELAQALDASA